MGGSESKVEQLNEVVTNITSKAMIKATANCSGTIVMSQKVYVGEDATVAGITMDQASKINLACLNNSAVSQSLQADLVSQMMSEATNASSSFPAQISNADSASKIENIMRTNLSVALSQQSIASLTMGMSQEQQLEVARGGAAYNVDMKQYADATASLVNSISAAVTTALKQDTEFKSKIEQTQTNFVADMLDSIASMFKLSPMAMIACLGSVFIIFGGLTIFMGRGRGGGGGSGSA